MCSPCPAGRFTNESGMVECSTCNKGYFAVSSGAIQCDLCSPDSYQNNTAQTACEVCELNQYIVYADSSQVYIAGECRPCPWGATCSSDGNITASAGSSLLIDQTAGTLSNSMCSSLARVDASTCWASSSSTSPDRHDQLISKSGLRVIDCCDDGRWPALVKDADEYRNIKALLDTGGHNVLCATCLPGHSSVNGRCIPCDNTHYDALVGMSLLALILVYLIHRLPHDWAGSATLLISTYFLQQSMLFLASESMPQVLSLVNMNLLGDHNSRGNDATGSISDTSASFVGVCIVPLDDTGRITMSLVSPLIAFGLLGVVALLQLAAGTALRHSTTSESALAYRAYRWLFVTSRPKLLSPRQAPAVRTHNATLSTSLLREDEMDMKRAILDDFSLPFVYQQPMINTERPLSTSMWRGYQRTFIRLALLSYTSLSVVTLSFFHHQPVGEFGWRLVDYPTISPDSVGYHAMVPFIVSILAIVVCGSPLALAIFLLVEHRRGTIEEAKQQQRAGAATLSTKQAVLLQLSAIYRSQYWWMAPFVLIRRLLLVALLVTVRDSDVWAWLTLVTYCLLALHIQLQPYERAVDNTLKSLTLLSLSVQTTLLSVWPPPYLSRALFGVFNALVIAPLVPLLVVMVVGRWRQCRATQQSSVQNDECEHEVME